MLDHRCPLRLLHNNHHFSFSKTTHFILNLYLFILLYLLKTFTMSGIVSHMVRRGLEATKEHYQQSDTEARTFQLPVWGTATIWISAIVYIMLMSAVR